MRSNILEGIDVDVFNGMMTELKKSKLD